MKSTYDFSKAVRNPYAKQLKRQLTIRLDNETIHYFQELSRELAIPYQTLMNMYLRDCAETGRRPHWVSTPGKKNAKSLPARKTAARRGSP
ncbi:MAG TPA: BrnA antitoxin family protein [Burkholderiales bacterium]|nr:BrnA antitoxin family protein [Burkholderiales bacterium]